jgi:hypothetical protein
VALADFPLLNSSLRADGEALVQHAAHNIGVAMATPSGLVARPRRHAAARTDGNPTSACTVKKALSCPRVVLLGSGAPGVGGAYGCSAGCAPPANTPAPAGKAPDKERAGRPPARSQCAGGPRHTRPTQRAAATRPPGAQVPNVKRAQERSLAGIAAELGRLQAAAAAGRLAGDDLAGGTLTVSNIGAIGGLHAAPLVNPPEVAIVALGRCGARARAPPLHTGSRASCVVLEATGCLLRCRHGVALPALPPLPAGAGCAGCGTWVNWIRPCLHCLRWACSRGAVKHCALHAMSVPAHASLKLLMHVARDAHSTTATRQGLSAS